MIDFLSQINDKILSRFDAIFRDIIEDSINIFSGFIRND
jgi:hypothetical protein